MKKKHMSKLLILTAGAAILGAGVYPVDVSAKAPTTQTKTQKKANAFYKLTATANVRATASMKGKVIEWAPKNSVVESLGTTGVWVKIKQDGKTGFVHKNSLKRLNASDVEKSRYQYVTSLLKGFKHAGDGKYVARFAHGNFVMIEFHEESLKHITLTSSTPWMFPVTDDSSDNDGYEKLHDHFERTVEALYGKNTKEYKKIMMEDDSVYGNFNSKIVKIGDSQVRFDQSRFPYEKRITISNLNSAVKMTSRHVVESSKTTTFKSKNRSTTVKKGTRMMKIGETKDNYYVQMGTRTGFVPKRDVQHKVDEIKTTNKTLSRDEMNKQLAKVSQRVNANKYIVKDGKNTLAEISFSSYTSVTPKLVLDFDTVNHLSISQLDESFALTEKEMEEREEREERELEEREANGEFLIPIVTIDKDGRVQVSDEDVYENVREETFYSKEEIIEAKRVRKILTPIISTFTKVQLGDTKDARLLRDELLNASNNATLSINGKQLLSEMVEHNNGRYTIDYKFR